MAERPPYLRIADTMEARIETGELRPGDRVPSTRQIRLRWGVAIATATKVLAALQQRGLVRAVPGVGTVVAERVVAETVTPGRRKPRTEPVEPGPEGPQAEIVRTALRIADAEGLQALTMRRIATALDTATMSLYRHVRNKDELIALMADAAFAGRPLPAAYEGWRERLEQCAHTQWGLYQAHPWLARTMSLSRPLLVPHGMMHIDAMLRALDGLGLDDNARMHTAVTLFGYVRGAAADLEAEAAATRDTGRDGEQWLRAREAELSRLLTDGALAAFQSVRRAPGVEIGVDSLFAYGLERFLDGVAALIDARRPAES
ncbi:TetR/AcrR family transcriptional regulator C-terminal domain-containing protein [Streptomyces indicus]|uniref:Regulatory protein, tetR family n=1 Tax=Streptomyces indicus TaxID=417292 RepID=A0A1G8ZNG7_9ACTN|nr:TetR/AcrR family transcriptional regulator C-terminal domain-containing protein [Streptomyces indicus]SDK16659.1 regulatory protein, tetR family [Streptomyces indicus]